MIKAKINGVFNVFCVCVHDFHKSCLTKCVQVGELADEYAWDAA